jgi:deoxycytidylate deaminase
MLTDNYMELLKKAYGYAQKSGDTSTQNGALLVNDQGDIVASGFNDIYSEFMELPERRIHVH